MRDIGVCSLAIRQLGEIKMKLKEQGISSMRNLEPEPHRESEAPAFSADSSGPALS